MFFDGDVGLQAPTCLLGTGHSSAERQHSSREGLGAPVGVEQRAGQKVADYSLNTAS